MLGTNEEGLGDAGSRIPPDPGFPVECRGIHVPTLPHPAHARQVRPCMERVGWVFGNGLHRNAAGHSGDKGD